jgi:alkylated DNA repair dioxygenase AlkB
VSTRQLAFRDLLPAIPEGLEYRADLLPLRQEADLLERLCKLEFENFEFRGYRGNRRVVSFGVHYDFDSRTVREVEKIPEFLLALRETAADFARVAAAELRHVLVAEYPPGAGIGWHKDRPVFGDVIGVSLAAPCRFRLRRKRGNGWERASLLVEPRSVYLLRGPARSQWEHSIPPGEYLRYSVTFRSVQAKLDHPTEEHTR